MLSRYEIDGTKVYKYVLDAIYSNMYIFIKDEIACVIDPHICEEADILLKNKSVKKLWIILTHEHYDHILGVNYYRERYDCTVVGSVGTKENAPIPTKNLSAYYRALLIDQDEETIHRAEQIFSDDYGCQVDVGFEKEYLLDVAGVQLRLVETPGHSKGSICIVANQDYVFTGDSLVNGKEIITRLPGGSKRDYRNITKPFLENLSKDMIVFPGHGPEDKMSCFEIA